MSKICKACSKIHTNHGDYCWKHYNQIRTLGFILDNNPRTKYDPNDIQIKDSYADIMTYDKWGNNFISFKIDIEDIPFISRYKWCAVQSGKSSLYYLGRRNKSKSTVLYHRIIMGEPNCTIDHINLDTTDNRKQNLRLANQSQQSLNQTIKTSNTSGIKGVCYIDRSRHNRKSGYLAELMVGKKKYRSKLFDSLEEASYCRYLFTQMYKEMIIPYTDMSWMNKLTESQKDAINKYFRNRWKHQV